LSSSPLLLAVTLSLITATPNLSLATPQRIVAASPIAAEIVCALDAFDRLVAVGDGATWPAELASLPRVGHERALTPEAMAALHPDLVLITTDAGPPSALDQLASLRIATARISSEKTADGARLRIREVAAALGLESRGETLVQQFDQELESAVRAAASAGPGPRVLFLYARGGQHQVIAGVKTAADELIRLAGATNATSQFEGYRPLTTEALALSAADVILMTESGAKSLGGIEAIASLPGLSMTPAGRAKRVITLDDTLLLGFGPRLGEAVSQLARALHSKPAQPSSAAR